MTINELLALAGLTASDEIPVWDAEGQVNGRTKKITAQNLAASIKTIASLIASSDLDTTPTSGSTKAVQSGGVYDAIQQSTAKDNLDLSSKTVTTTDVFTLTSGVYRCNPSAPNLPVQGAGYMTVIYRANDTRCLEYITDSGRFFTNTLYNGTWTGWKEYEDKQSTAWSNNWLTNTSILAYAASVANPSFTTFRTSATSTDVPIANEYYIGTVERYGQNITVKMTTMQDASKMYINNSVNGGSTWTGWKTFLDSQSTADAYRSGDVNTDSTGYAAVVFDPPFAEAPIVIASPNGSSFNNIMIAKVAQVTKNGFNLRTTIINSGSSTIQAYPNGYVYWVAIPRNNT